MTLLEEFEAHISALNKKLETMEKTGIPLPVEEVRRDMAIGIELYQRYIDRLDEAKEEILEGVTT